MSASVATFRLLPGRANRVAWLGMEDRAIHVVHVSPWRLPVSGYGGSQRVLTWLVRAQVELGMRVTVFAPPGTKLPGAQVVEVTEQPTSQNFFRTIAEQLPLDAHLLHFQQFPRLSAFPLPWVVTVHGNSPGELAPHPNKIFLSRDHAERSGSRFFVYNGLDPSEYLYRERKDDYFLFLAKVGRKSKGIDIALRLARELGFRLVVAGGTRWDLRKTGGWWTSLRCRAEFLGEVDGREKAELLANARALLFPIRWPEPFGLAVIEALVSGTPVITAPLGAMPEIVTPEVGFLCASPEEFRDAIRGVGELSSYACRQRVLEHFTHRHMARGYLEQYQRVLAGEGDANEKRLEENKHSGNHANQR
ncbi:Phosphatidyl-myo-inositol mannosyltransferase [bacterium HR30]|nr:Phosphatidyl-myo-inositol mannosyltransferase [bacterium HR30]